MICFAKKTGWLPVTNLPPQERARKCSITLPTVNPCTRIEKAIIT